MSDYLYQLDFVRRAAERLLWLQDDSVVSPSRGCFHYAYWRDKTSDVADARFQEAAAALGLLTHPYLRDASLPPSERLYEAFLQGARFWARCQHADGSFDEWYKNEHGFAATEFPVIAYALALHYLGDGVRPEHRVEILATLRKAADWLLDHDDHVKTNHEAAAAAGLAAVYALTGDERYKAGAEDKRDIVLRGQTEEGWFNEVAGMDLGYCGVLLDYMMLAHVFIPDERTVPAMVRLYSFLHRFIRPDLTIPAEAGICLNPYVSRLGTILLSPHSPEAADVARRFERASAGFAGVSPYLADDLRLCRWAYLPLVTWLVRLELHKKGTFAAGGPAPGPREALVFPRAGVFTADAGTLRAAFLPAGAGAVSAQWAGADGRILRFFDRGYVARPGSGPALFTGGYKADRPQQPVEGGLSAEIAFAPAVFFYPPYLARVVLRLGCSVPGGYYLLRKAIDLYRQWRGTALNQSAAPIASRDTGVTLRRRVQVVGQALEIDDEVRSARPDVDLTRLEPVCEGPAETLSREATPRVFRLRRRVGTPASAGPRTSA